MTDSYAGPAEEDLGFALSRLKAGDRVFITYADFAERYPSHGEGPTLLDERRMSELAELAAEHGCTPERVDEEKRIYFSKTSAQGS